MESASAFSVYAAKCKNTKQLQSEKRNKQNLPKALSRKSRKDVKRLSASQEGKGILNIFVKKEDKGGVIKKKV
jgi:hypothetical protein